MKVTLKELAKKVGVSESTVSRALNGYDDVSPKTRQKVVETAERLNYRPDAIARGLAKKKTDTIGLFMLGIEESSKHPFSMQLVTGIMDSSRYYEYDIVLFAENNTKDFNLLDKCHERGVDGAIVLGMKSNDPYIAELEKSSIPIVLIDIPIEGPKSSYVSSDNVEGAKMAVKYLLKMGHKNILYIHGFNYADVSQKRLEGYKLAYKEHGLNYDKDLIVNGKFEREISYKIVKKMIKGSKDITAIFAISDLMAAGAMKALKEEKIRIPEDISVIGFDDIELCTHLSPTLSTVRQKKIEIGQRAVEKLVGLIEGRTDSEPIILDCELVLREST